VREIVPDGFSRKQARLALDIGSSVYFARVEEVEELPFVELSPLVDYGGSGEDGLERAVKNYLRARERDYARTNDLGSDFAQHVATLMVDIGRPGSLFSREAASIASFVGSLLLQRKGWTTELTDAAWQEAVEECELATAGSGDRCKNAIGQFWRRTRPIDNDVFQTVREWARRMPFYGELKKRLKI
jgi:hypothetical protein